MRKSSIFTNCTTTITKKSPSKQSRCWTVLYFHLIDFVHHRKILTKNPKSKCKKVLAFARTFFVKTVLLSMLMIPVLAISTAACFMLRLIFSFLFGASVFFCMFGHGNPPLILSNPPYNRYYFPTASVYERKFMHH